MGVGALWDGALQVNTSAADVPDQAGNRGNGAEDFKPGGGSRWC
jgi:hypothetical protein